MDYLQNASLAISVAAGLAAVLGAVAQLTAAPRLRRWTEHLRVQFQATELSDYDRGIALSLHRQGMARLVALHALPWRHFVVPVLFFAFPLWSFWYGGRLTAGSPRSESLWTDLSESAGDPIQFLVQVPLVALGIFGSLSVMLGRRHFEQDYLDGKPLRKEVSYALGSSRTLEALGKLNYWLLLSCSTWSVLARLHLRLHHSGEGKPGSAPPPVLPWVLLIGTSSVLGGVVAILRYFGMTGREWYHEPLPIEVAKPAPKPPIEKKRRRSGGADTSFFGDVDSATTLRPAGSSAGHLIT